MQVSERRSWIAAKRGNPDKRRLRDLSLTRVGERPSASPDEFAYVLLVTTLDAHKLITRRITAKNECDRNGQSTDNKVPVHKISLHSRLDLRASCVLTDDMIRIATVDHDGLCQYGIDRTL